MCVHNEVSSAMLKERFPLHLLLCARKISTESTVNAESMFQINRRTPQVSAFLLPLFVSLIEFKCT